MKQVYADHSLPYRTDAKFKFPEGYNPCDGELGPIGYGGGGGGEGGGGGGPEVMDGAFE